MVRCLGRWPIALVAFAVLAGGAACKPKPAAAPADPTAGMSRGEIEMDLRQRVGQVEGDSCAKEAWLKKLMPTIKGLQFEVAEELLAAQSFGCRQLAAKAEGGAASDGKDADKAAPTPAGGGDKPADTKDKAPTPAGGGDKPADAKDKVADASKDKPADAKDKVADKPPMPPEQMAGPCTRRRAESDLRAKFPNRPLNRANIDAELERCFSARIAACQFALDADVDEGLTCWKQAPWPEVPASVKAEDVASTGMCLLELKAVIADLRKCRTKKPGERDACVAPYVGYSPQCALLKADRMWKAFPGREDVERVAKADAARRAEQDAKAAKLKADQEAKEAKLKAEREAKEAKLKAEADAKKAAEDAKIAKETERCFGRTTLDFAEKLRAEPGPRNVPGCKYQVVGRVVSKNNAFVQLVDPSGKLIFLLRTKEAFADGAEIADRTGTFDSIEEAEMADGSKRSFAVFKLDPAPPKKP